MSRSRGGSASSDRTARVETGQRERRHSQSSHDTIVPQRAQPRARPRSQPPPQRQHQHQNQPPSPLRQQHQQQIPRQNPAPDQRPRYDPHPRQHRQPPPHQYNNHALASTSSRPNYTSPYTHTRSQSGSNGSRSANNPPSPWPYNHPLATALRTPVSLANTTAPPPKAHNTASTPPSALNPPSAQSQQNALENENGGNGAGEPSPSAAGLRASFRELMDRAKNKFTRKSKNIQGDDDDDNDDKNDNNSNNNNDGDGDDDNGGKDKKLRWYRKLGKRGNND